MRDKVDPIDLIPKLKDERNYQAWAQQFRRAARHIDKDLLPVIEGEWDPVETTYRVSPSDRRIREILASHFRCRQRDIRSSEVHEWKFENIIEPNNDLKLWENLNNTALHLIRSSTTRKIQPLISNIHKASKAYALLKKHYGHSNAYTFPYWYSVWSGTIYRHGDNPHEFVKQWFQALHSMLDVCGDSPLPLQFQWAQFLEAVRNNPSTKSFREHSKFDFDNCNILKELADEFLGSQEPFHGGSQKTSKSSISGRRTRYDL